MHSIQTTVDLPLPETEAAVRVALGEQGFGVVSEIDVAANLRAALGVEREPLKILGACSPKLVVDALALDASVALVLPCNVVLTPEGAGTRVAVVDPRELMTDPSFQALATEAAAALTTALGALGGAVSEAVA
jgi:uncharacterized protein (DUF302 family)